MEELNALLERFNQTEDFLESMEILSEIYDLKIKLGLETPRVCETGDNECLNCSA